MFPTIYGIALYGLSGAEAKVGGSFLVMAILGGAVLTAIQGLLSTMSGKISLSYSIPVVCFVVVLIYGIYSSQNRELSTR
jgi:Fucose permease